MAGAGPGASRSARMEAWARLGFWLLLALTWVAAVAYMWDALTTVPDAERLEETKVVGIPTPRTFFTAAIFSAMELAVVLAVLWPRWTPYYASRLAVSALGVATWFVMTTPMDLSRMDWVHRRWLAGMVILILGALLVLLAYRLVRRVAAMST